VDAETKDRTRKTEENSIQGIRKAINERNLNEGQWEDTKQWSLGVGQRRKMFSNRYIYIYIVHMSWKCIADTTFIRLCISSCKAVESTVEIWYCCSTENFVWWIICSYRFGTVIILREVEFHHSFQNNLTYIKEMHTSLQNNKKVRANGKHGPRSVHIWMQN